MKFCLPILLVLLLCACSHTTPNTFQIGGGRGAIEANGSGLYVAPSLLGLEPDTRVRVNTSSSDEITFSVGRQSEERSDVDTRGGAF